MSPLPFVPLSEPVLAGNEWKYVKECLDTGWVSSVGPFVDRFEREFADYTGSPLAVATVNGTAALHVALLAVGVMPEDEVIVSDLTFVAPVNAIRYCSAHPVFMDVTRDTWQMDVSKLERFLAEECEQRVGACVNKRTGKRVAAIVPVHILGLACEIDRIVSLARHYHLRVVEDATEGLGTKYKGRQIGTFGDVGAFSFNGNKIITTGGGGMIVTADPAIERDARYLTTQAKDDSVEYVHNRIGFNYRLTNVQAAIGVAQLEQLGGFIDRKRAIWRAYDEALAGLSGVAAMTMTADTESNCWLYTMLLGQQWTIDERKDIVRRLNAARIGVRPLWHTIHDLPPYRSFQAYDIEQSVLLYERAVSLPSGAGLSDADVVRTARIVRDCVRDKRG